MSRRFSLYSLFLHFTCLVLLCACFALTSRMRSIEEALSAALQRVKRLEAVQGVVAAGDANRVQVLSIKPLEPQRWKWRVRRPKDAAVELAYRTGRIDFHDFTLADERLEMTEIEGDGEVFEVDALLHRGDRQKWKLTIQMGAVRSTSELSSEMQSWLDSQPRLVNWSSSWEQTTEFAPGEPIVLLRSATLERLGESPTWTPPFTLAPSSSGPATTPPGGDEPPVAPPTAPPSPASQAADAPPAKSSTSAAPPSPSRSESPGSTAARAVRPPAPTAATKKPALPGHILELPSGDRLNGRHGIQIWLIVHPARS